jgi:hypothetical protein
MLQSLIEGIEKHAREQPMRTYIQRTVRFGDLVAAVFDRAARQSDDPWVVSHLATHAVAHMLRHARNAPARARSTAARAPMAAQSRCA